VAHAGLPGSDEAAAPRVVPVHDVPRARVSQIKRDTLVGFVLCHAFAALALLPWFFSWAGVWLLVVGVLAFGVLGINVGFHRLLAHRGFSCPLWLERTLAILGTGSMQFSPAFWVAVHRRHHQFSDEADDPHSPRRSFWWSHFGWLVMRRRDDMRPATLTQRYAKDLLRDPLYAFLERKNVWAMTALAFWAAFFVAGIAAAAASGASALEAVQLGASLAVWGGALRTVLVWHTTWAVNSVSHVWGYRNYDTPDDSRNNWLVALLAAGEGWHNNHHADPVSPRHGHKWWEIDAAWLAIRALMWLGLAKPRRAARSDGPAEP
jgi:stearoyl-CoA desaturase (delta-9 desaturase)